MITDIYTIGVIAAYYAAFIVDEKFRLAASASSGMINGIATILLTLLMDPQSAIITDQALRGKRPEQWGRFWWHFFYENIAYSRQSFLWFVCKIP